MRRLKRLTTALIAIGSLTALPVWAADGSKPYVGANIGQSDWKDGINGVTGDSKDTAYKLYGGYQFNPYVGLELGYDDLGKLEGTGNARAHGVYLDAVGTLPLSTDWSLLGRIGVVNSHVKTSLAGVDSSSSGTDWKAGLGVQYNLTKNLSIRGEWERYRVKAFDTKSDADLASVGLVWGF